MPVEQIPHGPAVQRSLNGEACSVALIQQAIRGERDAQGRLVQLWYKRIYNFSYKFFFDHDMAMEAAQKTFISMCRHLAALQDAERFKSWLYKIAVNHCRDEHRRKVNARLVPLEAAENRFREESPRWEQSHVRTDNPEEVFRRQELSDILHRCLVELSAEQREVVIMKEFEGLKFREIAQALRISENTAKSRLYYGLSSLRNLLAQKNLTKDEIGYEP